MGLSGAPLQLANTNYTQSQYCCPHDEIFLNLGTWTDIAPLETLVIPRARAGTRARHGAARARACIPRPAPRYVNDTHRGVQYYALPIAHGTHRSAAKLSNDEC